MSISNNNAGVNANQNNQSLAAEGVVERGRFVISILADIYTYTYVWKCSRSTSGTCPFSFSLLLYSKTTNNDSLSIFIIYNIEFNVPIMYFFKMTYFSCLLLRYASQNSLDESSQNKLPRSKDKTTGTYQNDEHTLKCFKAMNEMRK